MTRKLSQKASLICLESSERFSLTAGKIYHPFCDSETTDMDGEEFVYVVNDLRRSVHVKLSRFELKTTIARRFLISALDDENGISDETHKNLALISDIIGQEEGDPNFATDIFLAVKATDGRYYLPEGHSLTA